MSIHLPTGNREDVAISSQETPTPSRKHKREGEEKAEKVARQSLSETDNSSEKNFTQDVQTEKEKRAFLLNKILIQDLLQKKNSTDPETIIASLHIL